MTEDEANTKTCHKTLAPIAGPNGIEHYASPCIGSACMAWRWDREGWALDFDAGGPFKLRKSAEAQGYCGLAGKP